MISNNFDALIVLSHLMNKDGELNSESRLRADKAASLFKDNPSQKIITCGWAYRDDSNIKISEAIKFYLINKHKIKSKNILIETNSRDTVGDAVFTRKSFIENSNFKKLAVITNFYHINRAKYIFNFVYGSKYNICFISCDHNDNFLKSESEQDSLKIFKKTFKGIKEGDHNSIYERMLEKHPLYNGDIYSFQEFC